jgi:hypothetical protein
VIREHTETSAELNVLVGGEILLAHDDDEMLVQRVLDLAVHRVTGAMR